MSRRPAGISSGPAPHPDEATLAASRPVKRSFTIAGHRTSISLEAAFWDAFRDLCEGDGVSMAERLGEIDRARGDRSGLSGAVRVWVLARYRRQDVPL